jgi:acetyltransferase
VGVLRVDTIGELFDMAEVLAKQPRPRGPRLAIITNAGGPAALATDRLVLEGAQIAPLSRDSVEAFDGLLPPHWSHGNPVDILGDAKAERYGRAVEIALRDPQNDGVLVILTPQAMTECEATARQLKTLRAGANKPLLASWMGGLEIAAGERALNDAGISTFAFPDTAARAFAAMWRYSHNLDALYETPTLLPHSENGRGSARAGKIIAAARKTGRTLLTELESKAVLAAYAIPTVETRLARTADAALEAAAQLGCPVVLKLHSETITHKSDVGGVKLNLRSAAAVRRAWSEIERGVPAADFLGVTVQPMVERDGFELILGSSLDAQFGPVLLFGAGGQFVEIFKDRALGLPPLNATLARRMIEQTRIFSALQGVRGRPPVDLAALEGVVVRFSQLVAEQRWIKEIDVNPLLAAGTEIIALDARVILHGPEVREEALPPLAIRPYPAQYVSSWKLRDRTAVTIRPIRPEDEPLMVAFHQTLSEESVHFRYFSFLKLEGRIAHERLRRICFIDPDREMALVVERRNGSEREILGVGRLTRLRDENEAEFAILISDKWQGHGLGTRLLELLVQIGRAEGLSGIMAHILPENSAMQHVAKKAGFALRFEPEGREWIAELSL